MIRDFVATWAVLVKAVYPGTIASGPLANPDPDRAKRLSGNDWDGKLFSARGAKLTEADHEQDGA